jgi:hypothetical protein
MMQPLDMRDLDEDRDDMSPMEKAMRSLVNFDDISKPIEAPQDRKSREVRETAKPNKVTQCCSLVVKDFRPLYCVNCCRTKPEEERHNKLIIGLWRRSRSRSITPPCLRFLLNRFGIRAAVQSIMIAKEAVEKLNMAQDRLSNDLWVNLPEEMKGVGIIDVPDLWPGVSSGWQEFLFWRYK